MGYVALTTHLRSINYSISHKGLSYLATIQNHCSRLSSKELMPDVDNGSLSVVQLRLFRCPSEPQCYRRCVQLESPAVALIPTLSSCSWFFDQTADLATNCSAHTIINMVRPAHFV